MSPVKENKKFETKKKSKKTKEKKYFLKIKQQKTKEKKYKKELEKILSFFQI